MPPVVPMRMAVAVMWAHALGLDGRLRGLARYARRRAGRRRGDRVVVVVLVTREILSRRRRAVLARSRLSMIVVVMPGNVRVRRRGALFDRSEPIVVARLALDDLDREVTLDLEWRAPRLRCRILVTELDGEREAARVD